MATRHHTVILVPHAQSKLRKWRISNRQIAVVLGLAVLVTGFAAAMTWAFLTQNVDRVTLERLRAENEELRTVNVSFEGSIHELEGRLSTFEERTRKLALVAGLDGGAGTTEAGIGGVLDSLEASFDSRSRSDLSTLAFRTQRLDGALQRVSVKLDERRRWVSSMPSITPVKGILTSRFGRRSDPLNGSPTHHPAVDISAPPGQPVHATADGIVTRAERAGGLGNAVYLSHGYGISTRYGHMQRLNVKAGQKVQRGDVIGFVGNTGRSTGYHLHYEVRVDGEAIDPLAYFLDD